MFWIALASAVFVTVLFAIVSRWRRLPTVRIHVALPEPVELFTVTPELAADYRAWINAGLEPSTYAGRSLARAFPQAYERVVVEHMIQQGALRISRVRGDTVVRYLVSRCAPEYRPQSVDDAVARWCVCVLNRLQHKLPSSERSLLKVQCENYDFVVPPLTHSRTCVSYSGFGRGFERKRVISPSRLSLLLQKSLLQF